jgi:RNA polymerase sigma-70 factor (ECF subfamily)
MESAIDNPQMLVAENEPAIGAALADDFLVEAVLAGDEAAFELIFNRYKRLVAHLAGKFFYNRGEVEEIVQQSFAKIYFSLKSFQGGRENSFSSWVSRITVNQCCDELRRRKRQPENTIADLSGEENGALENLFADVNSADAENSLINRDLAEKILSKLAADDRVAMTLHYAEELSVGEVARLVGWSESNVKIRLFRARNFLRKAFKSL